MLFLAVPPASVARPLWRFTQQRQGHRLDQGVPVYWAVQDLSAARASIQASTSDCGQRFDRYPEFHRRGEIPMRHEAVKARPADLQEPKTSVLVSISSCIAILLHEKAPPDRMTDQAGPS